MQQNRKTLFSNERAFTLLEIIIVVGLIGMLAGIAAASFLKARTQTQINLCITNLIRIDSAKEQLALEVGLTTGSSVVADSVNAYIKGGITPLCPAAGTYTYGTIGSNPVCTVSAHVLAPTSSSSGSSGSTPTTPPVAPRPPNGKALL